MKEIGKLVIITNISFRHFSKAVKFKARIRGRRIGIGIFYRLGRISLDRFAMAA
jgi:hypothetical protein